MFESFFRVVAFRLWYWGHWLRRLVWRVRPSTKPVDFSAAVAKTFEKRSDEIAANVTKNNALLERLKK